MACESQPRDVARSGRVTHAGAGHLARRLGTADAVVIGLGSMIGAGVFAAFGPAARAADTGLLIGLLVAAVIAYCNATVIVYLVVGVAALLAAGPHRLATAAAPLTTAVHAAGVGTVAAVVRIGGALDALAIITAT